MNTKFKKAKSKLKKTAGTVVAALAIMAMVPLTANAHCDTMEGPTVADGYKAIETGNVNYVLKWVQPQYEKEITQLFNVTMNVLDNSQSSEAKELFEQKFFTEVVKAHRSGEGAEFDGLKPLGTPVDEIVAAADESIAIGNLGPIEALHEEGLIPEERMPEITERFELAMSLKDYDVNDLEAGREYNEAYVSFFKFAEGEEEGHTIVGESAVLESTIDAGITE